MGRERKVGIHMHNATLQRALPDCHGADWLPTACAGGSVRRISSAAGDVYCYFEHFSAGTNRYFLGASNVKAIKSFCDPLGLLYSFSC